MRLALFLLVITLSIGISETTKAEIEEGEEIELEKIIITSRRTEISLSEATEDVVVISEDEIKDLPVRTLSEALSYIRGVDVERRQGFGRATSISIQGSDSRHVRVMIDGIPLNTQASGQVNPSKFPIENVARIEIIKGAASSIWGSSLGGVINIITKDTGKTLIPEFSSTTSFAEFRTKKESFDISGKSGDFGYYIFSSYMESGGKGLRDDVLEKKTFSKVSYDLKDMGKLIASFGYSDGDISNSEYPDGTWKAQPYRNQYGKIGWERGLGSTDISIDLKHSRQDIITKSFSSVDSASPSSIIRSKDMLYQLSLNSAAYLREQDLLVVGVDFDWDILKSTYLTESKSLNLQAPYVNYTLKSNPWVWNFGFRYDRNSEFGEELSPSIGAVYHLEDLRDALIRATVSRAFHAPPLLWKYYDESLSWVTVNPYIGAEKAWVCELGFEVRPVSRLWSKLSLYRADISNAIATATNDQGQYYKKNFEKFRRQGIELQTRINLAEGLNLSGRAAFNDIEDRATGETVQGGGKPRQSFDISIEYKPKNGFDASLIGYYDYWNEASSSEPNDRKMIFDLKLSKEFKKPTIFLNIYNLTNSKYWRDYFFPLPERHFEGGVSYKW